ncbi:hypothetical protein BG004_004140 [Podila humilis]|nr:hypothetical protein BG004_004140 [Podila humilis]
MDDINLDDEPFEQFDTYDDDYNERMMEEAEQNDQQEPLNDNQLAPNSGDTLPARQNFLALLDEAKEKNQEEFDKEQQQRQQQEEQRRQAVGLVSGVDIGAVQVVKKRVKVVTLDSERLLSEQGLPVLFQQGKRLKIRHKYTNQAEKNDNATWAHNLFPKSTFRDFIAQAESKCRSGGPLKASMNGWRDAHWAQLKQSSAAKEDAAREAEETRERNEEAWKAAGVTQDLEQDPLSLDDNGEGSLKSSGGVEWPLFSKGSALETSNSRNTGEPKGKGKTIERDYSASTAMRLAVSDDEEDNDYEVALSKMRESMNLSQNSIHTKKTETLRKREIDLDDYDSDVVEEEEEDEPLFTHRALQLMGGLEAIESRNLGQSLAPIGTVEMAAVDDDGGTYDAVEAMYEDRIEDALLQTKSAVVSPDSIDQITGEQDVDDDEGGVSSRKPNKPRRVLLLSDSE